MTPPPRARHRKVLAAGPAGWIKPGLALAAAMMLLAGCTREAGLTYEDQVLNQPLPDLEKDRVRECLAINRELARLQPRRVLSIKETQPTAVDAASRELADQLAILQQRAGNLGCFARRPPPVPVRVVPLVMDAPEECGTAARGGHVSAACIRN